MKAAAIIALTLVGAASVEAGAWKAPQLPRPKMRKLSEHDDTCTPGEMNQKFACEDGSPVMKMYAGSDTGCTGVALMSMDMTALTAMMLGGSGCISMPMDGPDAPQVPLSYSLGCVGDVPKMIVHNSTDCSGGCALAQSSEDMSTECTPSTCDDGCDAVDATICSNTDTSTENACGACSDTGECAACGECTGCYALLEADPTNAACQLCVPCLPCQECTDCDCDSCWGEDDEDDDEGDEDDEPPACLASCPQPQTEDVCGHIASVLAGASASCMDGCAGSASEMEANMMFLACGLPTVGGGSCGASTTPPATTTPPSAAGRVTGALGVVAAALGAVLM